MSSDYSDSFDPDEKFDNGNSTDENGFTIKENHENNQSVNEFLDNL